MKACFMGLGYIGLPTAIIAAKHGVEVVGVDVNPSVVEKTNQGHLHIVEPGLESMLQEVVKSGALRAQGKPETSDAYFMVVPTPFKGNHEPDISYVEAATRAVIPFLKEGDLYVIESTSPVGTTDKMATLIFAERPELEGHESRIDGQGDRVLQPVRARHFAPDQLQDGRDVQVDRKFFTRRADCLCQRVVFDLRQGGYQCMGID